MSLEEIYELKFMSKSLILQSKKAQKEEKKFKLNMKKSIENGDMNSARVYAQSAIRLENAQWVSSLSSQIKAVNNTISATLEEMNFVKVVQVMNQLESKIGELNTQDQYVKQMLDFQGKQVISDDDIDNLITMTADEYNIDLKEKFPNVVQNSLTKNKAESEDNVKEDLIERLSKLKA